MKEYINYLKKHVDILNILLIIFIWGIYWYYSWVSGIDFYYGDYLFYYIGRHFFIWLSYQFKFIPWFNPYIGAGEDPLANIQFSWIYPFNIFFLIKEFSIANKLFMEFHYLWAGLGFYLLFRYLRFTPNIALVSSILGMFNGYMISTFTSFNTPKTFSWSGWIIWSFLFFYNKKTPIRFFIASLILSSGILSGELQVLEFILLIAFVFILFDKDYKLKERKILIKDFLLFVLILVNSILLTLFQLVPFYYLVKLSHRSNGLSLDEIFRWSFDYYKLFTLILPQFLFSKDLNISWSFEGRISWLFSVYVGIIVLYIFIIGSFYLLKEKERKFFLFFYIIILLSYLLSLGDNFKSLNSIIFSLPFFNKIKFPDKFMGLFILSFIILFPYTYKVFMNKLYLKSKDFFYLNGFSILILGSFFIFIFLYDVLLLKYLGLFITKKLNYIVDQNLLLNFYAANYNDLLFQSFIILLMLVIIFFYYKNFIQYKIVYFLIFVLTVFSIIYPQLFFNRVLWVESYKKFEDIDINSFKKNGLKKPYIFFYVSNNNKTNTKLENIVFPYIKFSDRENICFNAGHPLGNIFKEKPSLNYNNTFYQKEDNVFNNLHKVKEKKLRENFLKMFNVNKVYSIIDTPSSSIKLEKFYLVIPLKDYYPKIFTPDTIIYNSILKDPSLLRKDYKGYIAYVPVLLSKKIRDNFYSKLGQSLKYKILDLNKIKIDDTTKGFCIVNLRYNPYNYKIYYSKYSKENQNSIDYYKVNLLMLGIFKDKKNPIILEYKNKFFIKYSIFSLTYLMFNIIILIISIFSDRFKYKSARIK